MAVLPPPSSSGGGNRRSLSSSVPDVLLSIVFPSSLICTAWFLASFFLGINNVKQFGAFGLCGLAAFLLYQSSSKDGGTIVNWNFSLAEWAMLALITHSIYFSVVHDLVTK